MASYPFNFGDADNVSFTGGGISTTTAATSVTILTLTKDARQVNMTNDTDQTVFVCRKRVGASGNPVPFDALVAGSTSKLDLRANINGWSKGDTIHVYASATPSGTFFMAVF